MAIDFAESGSGGSEEGSGNALTCYCPPTVNIGDVLIAHVYWEGTSETPNASPAGWTLLGGPYTCESAFRHWVWGKVAIGDEDADSITWDSGQASTNMRAAIIYRFRGRDSGALEQITSGFTSTTHPTDPQAPTVTTSMTGALAVALVGLYDNVAVGSFTGESGGDWTEALSEYTGALTPGLCLQLQTCTPTANPGTVSGGSYNITDANSGVIGFEIAPSPIPISATDRPSGLIDVSGTRRESWTAQSHTAEPTGAILLSGSANDTYVSPFPVAELVRHEPPSSAVFELELSFGPTLRFSPDENTAGGLPNSISFTTEMPGGFSAASIQITKPELWISSDALMGDARIYEYETDRTYWEGRIVGVSEAGDQVTLEGEGWAKHLADDHTARAIFVDRDFSRWTPASLSYKIYLLQDQAYRTDDPTVEADPVSFAPALQTGASLGGLQPKVAWLGFYGFGLPIGLVDYAWKRLTSVTVSDSGWWWGVDLSDDDMETTYQTTGDLRAAGPGSGTLTATGATKFFASAQFYYEAPGDWGDEAMYAIYWTHLGVFGDHGLTPRGTLSAPNNGRGLYLSDMVPYCVERWAPILEIGDVEDTTFAIPHAVFAPDPTTAFDMITGLCAYGGDTYELMDYWVEEGKTFRMASPSNHGTTWRTRYSEGTEASNSGADLQSILNGVIVSYDDGTGTKRTIGPIGSDADSLTNELLNSDDANPANREVDGQTLRRWEVWDAGVTTGEGALLLGQILLNTRAQGWQDWRGDIQIKDRVRDSNSAWHPAAAVRAGDWVVVEDDEDTRPRKIVSTSYDASSKTVSCSIGAPP